MERVAYRHLLDQLTEWATHHPDVIGLVAVGSTASTERIPDEYSDHDLIVVTRPGTSDAMRDDQTWVPGHEHIIIWHPESEHGRAVIFDDGHLIEVAVLDDNDIRTKREAQAACNELAAAMQRGDYLQANRQTVGEFVEEWLATIAPTARPSTLDKYNRDLRAHVIRHIGFVQLAKLDGPALNRLWAQLAVSGRKPASPGGLASGLSAKSVENVAMTVHRMLRDAVRWGRIPKSPAEMADPPKRSASHRPIKAWTVDTLRTFLEATRDDELSALWMLIATTGLRRGEALGLRWSDVDLETGRAQINQTVIAIGWNVHFGQPKTQAGRRPIALDPATVEVLRKHRRAMHARPASAGTGGDQLVFCGPDGAAHHPERVYQAFRRAVIRHHLPPIPLHGLRHTWATLALQMDVHPRVVQERLGHSNIAITLQTYSHVLPIMHDDAAATVAALFMPDRG